MSITRQGLGRLLAPKYDGVKELQTLSHNPHRQSFYLIITSLNEKWQGKWWLQILIVSNLDIENRYQSLIRRTCCFLYRLAEVFSKRNNWIWVAWQSSSSVNSDLAVLNVKGEPSREKGQPSQQWKKLRVHLLLSWAVIAKGCVEHMPQSINYKLWVWHGDEQCRWKTILSETVLHMGRV